MVAVSVVFTSELDSDGETELSLFSEVPSAAMSDVDDDDGTSGLT